jgi:hypothetical protein
MSEEIEFDKFLEQWLVDIQQGNPSTIELGRNFAQKLVTQWLDVESTTDDLVYCDGSGDGGIDIAYLDRGDNDEDEEMNIGTSGHTWYLVQSKYGKAFQGVGTLLEESLKVIDTLDGRRQKLSSLAEGLVEKLTNFRKQASEQDKICLVFATEYPLDEKEKQVLKDVRAMGRERLKSNFDVESISIETIFRRTLEDNLTAVDRIRVSLNGLMVNCGDDLLIGALKLLDLYEFLKAYRDTTEDLDQLYERNVRRFLGNRGKVNKAIQETLKNNPELFGLYNNGITIVVNDFTRNENNFELVEPFVVNGCQTTRTVWAVCNEKLEAGGTGISPELEQWKTQAAEGVIITKIVKVGDTGEELERAITRYTNSQNSVREKDFLALTLDFRTWASLMAERYDIYLEIQRGGWDSRKALQKQRPEIKQFIKSANAFDLIKVYGAGWFGEAGIAFGKNGPFLPNGSVFKRITENTDGDESIFGVDDLFAAYTLQSAANNYDFGRGASKATRRQTKFLFYMVAIDLLKDIMNRSNIDTNKKNCTNAIISLFKEENIDAANTLLNTAIEVIDSYFTEGTEASVFDEPAYKSNFNYDLNAFLKWDKLGKTEADCPRLRSLLGVSKISMGHKLGGNQSVREIIQQAITLT